MGYVFDPEVLHDCANHGVGLPLEEAFNVVTDALTAKYPKYVHAAPRSWVFNNAGGAMGQMTFLHASLTEYLIFFGSPIGTEGHSGRYRTEVWDFMIQGEMWTFVEGDCERQVFKAGDGAYLGSDRAKGYRIPDSAWMLEYSRGAIPTMVPFGLADTLMSTLDLSTLGRTLFAYGNHVVKNLLQGKI